MLGAGSASVGGEMVGCTGASSCCLSVSGFILMEVSREGGGPREGTASARDAGGWRELVSGFGAAFSSDF